MQGNPWLAANYLDSQEVIYSLEYVSKWGYVFEKENDFKNRYNWNHRNNMTTKIANCMFWNIELFYNTTP